MSTQFFKRRMGSDGARLRAVRRHILAMQRLAGHGARLALLCIACNAVPNHAAAQVGQAPMAPSGGLLGSAASGFQRLNSEGPGILYYGINGADRGLGYRGSYMTLGGYVPVVEDDLGGLWSADVRGHLSTYGGFFSNFGAVRKQFIGGSLLGVGVYWDYDGDLNQYPDTPVAGTTYVFPGGQVYNQVGVSGEWLTDWGNIRSNGYIPVGSTAQLVGPFLQNVILCENGVNAALGGADLELGAYIPGLSDWAGMVSVGGYALGNTRYTFPNGTGAVPWFGGVYTRLDMTFIENWDFSLQANNDSYFDWTGFARLTYRMGGSRRRNVPDQMEQPMMRNEHIVRAHQVPEVALNPNNLDASGNPLPWRVYYVNNAAAPGGDGTYENPYSSLGNAMARPVNSPYDIVYVQAGNSGVVPYVSPAGGFMFGAANQYLIGQGSTLAIPTVSCGNLSIFSTPGSTAYPTIFNPIGPAIVLNQPGVTVNHVSIVNSPVGIADAAGPPVASGSVSDVFISGNGGTTLGIQIANSTGAFNFDNVRMSNLTNGGVLVSAANADVALNNSSLTNISGTAVAITGASATATLSNDTIDQTVGTAVEASGAGVRLVVAGGDITNTSGDGIVSSGSNLVTVNGTRISSVGGSALVASGQNAWIQGTRVDVVESGTASGAVAAIVSGSGATLSLQASRFAAMSGGGIAVSGSNARMYLTGTSRIDAAVGDGVAVTGSSATVLIADSAITNSTGDGVSVIGYQTIGGVAVSATNTQVTILRSSIAGGDGRGVYAEGVNGGYTVSGTSIAGSVVQVFGSQIAGTSGNGVVAASSNVDIGRDPTTPNGRATSIQGTGNWGVEVTNQLAGGTALGPSRVRVANTNISGVATGINAASIAPLAANTVSLTALSNNITTSAGGPGIIVTGNQEIVPTDTSVLNANIASNRIVTSGTVGIRLDTTNAGTFSFPYPINIENANSEAQLGAVNYGTQALQFPRVGDPYTEHISWQGAGRLAELPPNPPVPVVPLPPP